MESFRKLDELLSTNYPAQEYVVHRLIPDAAITILSGTSRSFKTYTLLELAKSVASGAPLFGQYATHKAGVLFIDEENGGRLLQKRLKQLEVASDLPIYFSRKMGFKLDPENVASALHLCKKNDIKLVIIDSLIRIHNADENSARDMSQVFNQLRRFTRNSIAVLVTQHNRKQGAFNGGAGNEMRGSSDILAAVDAHIGVTRKNKWYLVFDQTKQRYDVELDPFQVKVAVDDKSFGFEYLGTIKPHADGLEILRTAVITLLKEHEQLMQKAIAEKLMELDIKTNEHKLRDALNLWIAEGLLTTVSGSGNAKLYRLSEVSNE